MAAQEQEGYHRRVMDKAQELNAKKTQAEFIQQVSIAAFDLYILSFARLTVRAPIHCIQAPKQGSIRTKQCRQVQARA